MWWWIMIGGLLVGLFVHDVTQTSWHILRNWPVVGHLRYLLIKIGPGLSQYIVAREAMLSIGCIQAQKCHTGHCPTGVATHGKWLQRGLVPDVNAKRFAAYINAFRTEVQQVTYACGYRHPGEFTLADIECSSGPNRFSTLEELLGYEKKPYAPESD